MGMTGSVELAQEWFKRSGVVYEVGSDGKPYGSVEVGGRLYEIVAVEVMPDFGGGWRESLLLPNGQWVMGRVVSGVGGN